ncbi:ATP-binding protein [Streptomyces sp. NBC_01264]|uniref:ATP-binding protein n=1 Tax=Streptomyces sp. NBC_01264 TaxID=2903804 RepID=UPI0022501747|nr:ATP-binding protein [Streptomyces sp. NBC_01264]MCX4775910.1 ATP-binding protein [Streptomyces sp. NBC_01264]
MSDRRSPERTRRLLLHGTEDAVGRCRDFTRRALTEWQWLPETDSASGPSYGPADEDESAEAADDVLLLVSEVVANACMHTSGPVCLLLHCTPERLRIEVTDPSPVMPLYRFPADPARPGGHGLLIVERLAGAWGADPVDGGKCVWVEVITPRALRGTPRLPSHPPAFPSGASP